MPNASLHLLYINGINLTKNSWPLSNFRTISVNHQYITATLIDANVLVTKQIYYVCCIEHTKTKCHIKLYHEHNSIIHLYKHIERITFSPVSPLMPSSPCSPCKRRVWCKVMRILLTVHGIFKILAISLWLKKFSDFSNSLWYEVLRQY